MAEIRSGQCTRCLKTPETNLFLSKLLSCDHLFCNECSPEVNRSTYSCPRCRPPLPVPEVGQQGTDSLSNANPVTNTCKEEALCSDHKQKFDFYCKTCTVSVCSTCLLTTHEVGKHEISTVQAIISEKVKECLQSLDEIHLEATTFFKRIKGANQSCKVDEKDLRKTVLSTQVQATSMVQRCTEKLLERVKDEYQATSAALSSLNFQWETLAQDVKKIQENCRKVNISMIEVHEIKIKVEETIGKYNQLKTVQVPSKLNLAFEPRIRKVTIGEFTSSPVDAQRSSYDMLITSALKVVLKDSMEVENSHFDYANIVCIDEDWIVHLSNLDGSLSIDIRHFSVKAKSEHRKVTSIQIETFSWKVAKTASHDRSILIASGNFVHRISFRMKDSNINQTLKVTFDIETITWDEFGVDCYLLAKDLRSVYWLSMSGEVRYLCSMDMGITSPSSMHAYHETKVAILDIASREVHVRDFVSNERGQRQALKQSLPDKWQSFGSSFIPRVIASMDTPMNHFIMFSYGEYLAVGQYDEQFRFVGWILTITAPLQENIMDFAIKGSSIYLIFETKLLIYKITDGASS